MNEHKEWLTQKWAEYLKTLDRTVFEEYYLPDALLAEYVMADFFKWLKDNE